MAGNQTHGTVEKILNLNSRPFPSSVALGKYFNIPVLQFLCLQNNNRFSTWACLKDVIRCYMGKRFVKCKS